MTQPDVLSILRSALSINKTPFLTTSADATLTPDTQPSLAQATHLLIDGPSGKNVFPLSVSTRFLVKENAVDLRTIFFAWLKKDAQPAEYISSIQKLNAELSAPGAAGGKVQNLPFAERLDLNSWLGGQQDESEYIKPLEGAAAGGSNALGAAGTKKTKENEARLREIYRGERRICDRNSILHGIKPTDFSHVRRQVAALMGKGRSGRPGEPVPAAVTAITPGGGKKPNQRPSPIILLSPSASSLLRMSNIKKFLEEGIWVPSDSELATQSGANRLHIMRSMPSVDPSRALQFVLMETTDQFRPEYWSRLVAVFTTGQEWQFKNYKWSQAQELFSRVLGVYVGFNGEPLPQNVQKWGRIVKVLDVEKWSPSIGEKGRWKDREVVEDIWASIEESMRSKDWTKENGIR